MLPITDRLRVHSHQPGHEALIPGTHWKIQAFPAALQVTYCLTQETRWFFWHITGPVSPFTIEQDVDALALRIYGTAKQGYFRFVLKKVGKELVLIAEKTPPEGIFWSTTPQGERHLISSQQSIVLAKALVMPSLSKERLFLGSSKQKEWEGIYTRRDLAALLPLWFALGQVTPVNLLKEEGRTVDLLRTLEEQCLSQSRLAIHDTLHRLCFAGFSGGLVPRGEDDTFQGLVPPSVEMRSCPLSLLTQGAKIVRSLFFQENETEYHILPCLLPGFTCGRMFFITTKQGDQIAFSWSKGRIRQVALLAQYEGGERLCHFPKGTRSYRVRQSRQDSGKVHQVQDTLVLPKAKWLWLDRFTE
ncbi:MAG: hypothetical protein FJZ58_05025 [Chlamydiae bacterium]|nr:hypothetical protein [Chlamydiota bacterium]